MNLARRPKIVLLGMMTKMPVAGVVWQVAQYLVGLERLGYDPYYIEAHAQTPSNLMQSVHDDGSLKAAEFISSVMDQFGFSSRWAYHALHDDARLFGLSQSELINLYKSAALLINLHGGHVPLEEHAETGRLIFLETDPVQVQIQLYENDPTVIDYLEPHVAFFTFGENYGRPDCKLPTSERFLFRPTRQPVVMDFWHPNEMPPGNVFTTVGNWFQQYREIKFRNDVYQWSKNYEFLKFIDLPKVTGEAFELALSRYSEKDKAYLENHGWRVRRGLDVSQDKEVYRLYIQSSRGEFTTAKDQNVRLRSGWFSDRSAAYLASGRPVITQETGFTNIFPTGDGLFSFTTIDEAGDALEKIGLDYEHHSKAAVRLAQEFFDSDLVLGRLLAEVGFERRPLRPQTIPPAAMKESMNGKARLVSEKEPLLAFPPALDIVPTGRHPTQLPRGTIDFLRGERSPVAPAQFDLLLGGETPIFFRAPPGVRIFQLEGSHLERSALADLSKLYWIDHAVLMASSASAEHLRQVVPSGWGVHSGSIGENGWAHVEENYRAAFKSASVVITSYNALDFTKLCLQSVLANTTYPNYEIVVVDNASTDGTREYLTDLKEEFPQLLKIVLNGENRGFAGAVNDGLARADGEILVIANSDTMFAPGWLTRTARWLDDDQIGLVGPVSNGVVNEAYVPTSYQTYAEFTEFARSRFDAFEGRSFEIGTPLMFCVAMSRKTYESVGNVDESFGVGLFEDDDYAFRTRRLGYRVICMEDVYVHHFGEASFGHLTSDGQYAKLFEANRRRFEEKWGLSWAPHRRLLDPNYEKTTRRIKQVVKDQVPEGASLVVVSRGDERLLGHQNRQSAHFPQDEKGRWAGYHPRDGAEAVAELERMRSKGWKYLLVPENTMWWMDYYQELTDHLDTHYRLVAKDQVCLIYDLR